MSERAHRYEDLGPLGEGGMGAVRRVRDAARQEIVAQKRIHVPDPAERLRFKREFRAIERLLHPNLVRLHELGEDAQGPYFTMELVEGVDLEAYCRGSPAGARHGTDLLTTGVAPTLRPRDSRVGRVDTPPPPAHTPRALIERLAHALPQVLEALSFLHAHGIVHRDLKPPNVMVDARGTVKLLDFGILATRDEPAEDARHVSGTIGFIAPELLRGEEPMPESDLYSLGATIFRLVSGRAVFEGILPRVMLAHLEHTPPRLDAVAPEAPAALADLCEALLAKAPEARPDLREVGARLGAAIGARAPVLAVPRPALVDLRGREAVLGALARSLDAALDGEGAARLLVLRGASGSGKSALAAHVVAGAVRARGALVLRGRGRPNDRVPFNAIDGAVDQLRMALGRRPGLPADIGRAAAAAAAMFPVLGDLGAGGPATTRRAAFEAVERLFAYVACDGPLVVSIDDLQWADGDSLALLAHLLDARAPGTAWVATLRTDVEPGEASELVARRSDVETCDVGPLAPDALAAIVEEAAREAGATPDAAAVARVVALSGGRPFLAALGGRALGRDDSGALSPLVGAAVAREPELLALVLLADGWSRLGELAALTGRRVGELDDAARELTAQGILRRSGPFGRAAALDVYHDALRAPLEEALPAEVRARAHHRLADAIAAGALDAPPERLVGHLVGAGRLDEAGRAALRAAREAEDKLAFSLAADLYGAARAYGGGERDELARSEARALAQAGRYGEAAERWDELARGAHGTAAAYAALHAAHALMAGNRIDEGMDKLDRALAAVGDPPIGARDLPSYAAAVGFLVGAGTGPVRATPGAPAQLEKAECDARVATLVGFVDPLAGVRVLRRARRGFAAAGAAERVAWCDLMFAFFSEVRSGALEPPWRARHYRARGERLAAARGVASARVDVVREVLDGMACFRRGDWAAAATRFERTLARAEASGAFDAFEHSYLAVQTGFVEMVRQRPRAVVEWLRAVDARVRDGHDVAVLAYVHAGRALVRLWQGDRDASREGYAQAIASLPRERPTNQRAVTWMLRLHLEIHDGSSLAREALRGGELALAVRHGVLDGYTGNLYGGLVALAHATALRAGDRRADPDLVRRMVERTRGKPPCGAGDAERAMAYLEDREGRPGHALGWLARAEREARAHDRPIAAATARYQRGLRLGGDEGAALRTAAVQAMEALGADPRLCAEDPAYR
ncbi:MAG: protein kinase [Sandaracinaceae bacterium]|nr:protein kinase [Sandaracinaceae bacterium]